MVLRACHRSSVEGGMTALVEGDEGVGSDDDKDDERRDGDGNEEEAVRNDDCLLHPWRGGRGLRTWTSVSLLAEDMLPVLS